ncbi:L,D-transpeptidase [Coprococcus sp. OM06-25]
MYKNSGSHGCVNLPVSAAEQLFNIVYDGMPVICYY